MNNKFLISIIMALIALFIIFFVWRIDSKSSHDTTKDYIEKDPKKEESLRISIPISYSQFLYLIVSFKDSHPVDLNNMGVPKYNDIEGNTQMDISKISAAGRSLLTGTNMKIIDWCKENYCVFPTSINEKNDTIVSCPADLMVRLVKNKEEMQ